jgi:AcrR family transcriptional regulator
MTDTDDGASTRERILDVAERLFAERGIRGASLRAITDQARVNLAAVHYHFGSKDALVLAVFRRRLATVNRERLRRLDAAEATGRGEGPAVETIVEALLAPVLRLVRDAGEGGRHFARLMGRSVMEPDDDVHRTLFAEFGPVIERFAAAFERALPGRPRAEILWRMFFTMGAMAYAAAAPAFLAKLTGGLCDPADVEATTRRLVRFTSHGFRTP